MKFIISVVMLALAVSSQAGLVPGVVDVSAWGSPAWGSPSWGSSGWGGPGWGPSVVNSWGSPWGQPSLTAWGNNGWGVGNPWGASLGVGPVLGGHGHDGQYVAANRGSVHVAPLVGHIQSVSSSNLQPAPGTTW